MGHFLENHGGTVLSSTEVVRLAPEQESSVGGERMMGGRKQEQRDDATCVDAACDNLAMSGLKVGDKLDQVESKSRPPSPPESGTVTPALRRSPCPPRLRPLLPPPNYGVTTDETIFRSAYPQDRNLDFLKLLGVRTVLCLVETEPSDAYSHWISSNGITRLRVDVAANKEGKVKTTWDSLCETLLIVMDSANYPLYIHCNQGKHRTGCVIACLRRIQHWPIEDVIAEYHTYSDPKARPGDTELIREFEPEVVLEYAKRHGRLDDRPFMHRSDSVIANIDALADALAGKPPYCDDIDLSMASNASTFSDDSFEMTLPVHDVGPPTPKDKAQRPSLQRTTSQLHAASELSDAAEAIMTGAALPEVTTTSVVELSDDLLTPPPDNSAKMLGEEHAQPFCQ